MSSLGRRRLADDGSGAGCDDRGREIPSMIGEAWNDGRDRRPGEIWKGPETPAGGLGDKENESSGSMFGAIGAIRPEAVRPGLIFGVAEVSDGVALAGPSRGESRVSLLTTDIRAGEIMVLWSIHSAIAGHQS